jgi:cell wall-associated NlpC family hydrolase
MAYYARRYYRPRSSGRMSGKELAVVVAIGLLAATSGRTLVHDAGHAPAVVVADAAQPTPAAARAIAYARAQLGKAYEWGGTGPHGFDCSGLVMMAWRSAGVDIARTTFTQWDTLRHIPASDLRPGDLIYYAGSDGTVSNPGHVVMYLGGGMVIQAYATGYPIRINSLASMGTGELTGYARP